MRAYATQVPPEMAATIRRIESQIDLSGAGLRYRRAWIPQDAESLMILVHGYAEHSGRYDEMAMHFAERGAAVHAYDQAGHGRTQGPRGDVDSPDRLLDELARFVDVVAAGHPGLPMTLVGHSMGGLIVAATAAFRSPPFDRIILSGALLQLGADTPAWKRLLSRVLAPLGARVGLPVGIDAQGLSRDPEVVRRYESDPLVKDWMSARFATGLMSIVRSIGTAAAGIRQPAMILHGGADRICPVEGSRVFHAGLSSSIAASSRLQIYPELRHEIFQEPERDQVWRDMLAWMASPSGADEEVDFARSSAP